VEGRPSAALTTVVRSGLRFVSIVVPEGVESFEQLDLPDRVHLVARSRGDKSYLIDESHTLEEGDEIVLIVEEDQVGEIHEKFGSPKESKKK
jgi:Trk K+ transport system NAD-binding subunit